MYPTVAHFIKDVTGCEVPLPFATFGLFMAIAFLMGALILRAELKRKESAGLLPFFYKAKAMGSPWNIRTLILQYNKRLVPEKKLVKISPSEMTWDIILIAALCGIVGARIFHLLENITDFLNAPLQMLISRGGFTFYGGLIAGGGAVVYYAYKRKIPLRHLADAAAPALLLAYAVGRLGCHLSGDGDWGIDNFNPVPSWLSFMPKWVWSFDYPNNVLNAGVPIPGSVGPYNHVLATPVFPTPLYEFTACLILFTILWIARKRIRTPGLLFCLYLILTSIERFLIERIRIDTEYNIWGYGIKQAEIISVILFLIAIAGIFYLKRVRLNLTRYGIPKR